MLKVETFPGALKRSFPRINAGAPTKSLRNDFRAAYSGVGQNLSARPDIASQSARPRSLRNLRLRLLNCPASGRYLGDSSAAAYNRVTVGKSGFLPVYWMHKKND